MRVRLRPDVVVEYSVRVHARGPLTESQKRRRERRKKQRKKRQESGRERSGSHGNASGGSASERGDVVPPLPRAKHGRSTGASSHKGNGDDGGEASSGAGHGSDAKQTHGTSVPRGAVHVTVRVFCTEAVTRAVLMSDGVLPPSDADTSMADANMLESARSASLSAPLMASTRRQRPVSHRSHLVAEKVLAFLTKLQEVDRVLVHLCAVPQELLPRAPPETATATPAAPSPSPSPSPAPTASPTSTHGGDSAAPPRSQASRASSSPLPPPHPFFRVLASLSVSMWHRWFDVERMELLLPVGSAAARAAAKQCMAQVFDGWCSQELEPGVMYAKVLPPTAAPFARCPDLVSRRHPDVRVATPFCILRMHCEPSAPSLAVVHMAFFATDSIARRDAVAHMAAALNGCHSMIQHLRRLVSRILAPLDLPYAHKIAAYNPRAVGTTVAGGDHPHPGAGEATEQLRLGRPRSDTVGSLASAGGGIGGSMMRASVYRQQARETAQPSCCCGGSPVPPSVLRGFMWRQRWSWTFPSRQPALTAISLLARQRAAEGFRAVRGGCVCVWLCVCLSVPWSSWSHPCGVVRCVRVCACVSV